MLSPDAQDRQAVTKCGSCKGEIWHDEPLFQWGEKWVCLECFKDRINALLENDPVLLAYEMQVEVIRYV